MTNTEKLRTTIADCVAAGDKVLDKEAGGEMYNQVLLRLIEIMKTITEDEIKAAGYPANIQNTLLMDRHLIQDTLTEEIDQLSLLSTVVTYISCNSEGRPGHSAVYMDKVTALRKSLEEVYDKKAIRFCGSDGC